MEDNKNLSEETTKVEDTTLATDAAAKVDNNGAGENSDASTTENVNDVEFTDTKEAEETPKAKEEVKPQQDNSENARRRREAERQAELKKARYDAIKEAVDGVNPFTNQPIEDDIDVEEYLAMKEIKKQGGDPLTDYSKYHKDKQKEEAKIAEQKLKDEEWIENDYKDFKSKHPEVNLEKLALDTAFMQFAEELVGKKPMAEIYDSYQDLVSKIRKEENNAAARQVANAKATPGSLTSSETDSSNDFYSVEQVKKMSQEEVHKNYDKIMASMKKWK